MRIVAMGSASIAPGTAVAMDSASTMAPGRKPETNQSQSEPEDQNQPVTPNVPSSKGNRTAPPARTNQTASTAPLPRREAIHSEPHL
jgi:hypothetical protein